MYSVRAKYNKNWCTENLTQRTSPSVVNVQIVQEKQDSVTSLSPIKVHSLTNKWNSSTNQLEWISSEAFSCCCWQAADPRSDTPVRHVERLTKRGHSLHLAFCSNLSFSSDSAAIETGKREAVSFDVKARALISTD